MTIDDLRARISQALPHAFPEGEATTLWLAIPSPAPEVVISQTFDVDEDKLADEIVPQVLEFHHAYMLGATYLTKTREGEGVLAVEIISPNRRECFFMRLDPHNEPIGDPIRAHETRFPGKDVSRYRAIMRRNVMLESA